MPANICTQCVTVSNSVIGGISGGVYKQLAGEDRASDISGHGTENTIRVYAFNTPVAHVDNCDSSKIGCAHLYHFCKYVYSDAISDRLFFLCRFNKKNHMMELQVVHLFLSWAWPRTGFYFC
jgi:hypothetical protein